MVISVEAKNIFMGLYGFGRTVGLYRNSIDDGQLFETGAIFDVRIVFDCTMVLEYGYVVGHRLHCRMVVGQLKLLI